jgi:cytochrome P450
VLQNAGFITMDGPRHTAHRKVVQPVSSPRNLKKLEPIVRERVTQILDSLPIGEAFDWVDRVSIELTTSMLATMFDFDWETRRKLTYWSDIATWARPWRIARLRCSNASMSSRSSGTSERGGRPTASTS